MSRFKGLILSSLKVKVYISFNISLASSRGSLIREASVKV
jgi:hypothetical protein